MTSHIVFGEGRNDVYFMQKVIESTNDEIEVQTFYGEELDDQNPSAGEEEGVIRDFRRDNDCDHLVKSEGSDSNLYLIFAYSCEKILTGQIECTLVADLDTDPIENLESDVQEALDTEFDGHVEWQRHQHRETVGDLKIWSVEIEDTSLSVSSEIDLVTFDDDLEAAVGCSSDDPRRERFPQIRSYAERTAVRRAFIDLYD
jgi:hypothetical protein